MAAAKVHVRSDHVGNHAWTDDGALGEAALLRELAELRRRAAENEAAADRHRQTVEALRESEARFRELFDDAPVGYHELDGEGCITRVNRTALAMLGYTSEEMLGRPVWAFVAEPLLSRQAIAARLAGAIPQGACEQVFRRKDGSLLRVLSEDRLLWDETGRVTGLRSTLHVISARTQAIEQERATLLAIIENMTDGLLMVDAARNVRHCNARAGELLGIAPSMVIGQSAEAAISQAAHALADPEPVHRLRECIVANPQHSSFEITLSGPPRRDIAVDVFQVADAAGTGLGTAILLCDVTNAKLLALLQERERIARDLHDGVMQALYGVVLGLAARGRTLDENTAKTREALRQAMTKINDIIQEMRNYIFGLRPRGLGERGLHAGLQELAQELRTFALVQPELELDGDAEGLLSPDAVASLLHVAREATSNVIRHAGAGEVKIRLARAGAYLVLAICDNGRGFDLKGAGARAGQGLRNMADRARMLGGHLAVRSEPGGGTEVRLEVPLRESMLAA